MRREQVRRVVRLEAEAGSPVPGRILWEFTEGSVAVMPQGWVICREDFDSEAAFADHVHKAEAHSFEILPECRDPYGGFVKYLRDLMGVTS